MQITVTRLDNDGRYLTRIERDDGVRYCLRGVGHAFDLPHDVTHFVVESTLGISSGFWGSVADGAVFATMSHEGGRRKPKASERSKLAMKANARSLIEAEVLVSVFDTAIEQGLAQNSPALLAQLKERRGRGKLPHGIVALIPAVYSSYHEALRRWRDTPVNGSMTLNWKTDGARRARPR
jgi:hypothetical protein